MDGSWLESGGIRSQHGYYSSGNSNSSSISTSSDSDCKMTTEAGESEADADSLTCGQSGLSSTDQRQIDGSKLVLPLVILTIFMNEISLFFNIYIRMYVSMCLEVSYIC